jgi:predicted dehydrogenase
MANLITRRRFMQATAATAAVTAFGPYSSFAKGPNEKLNIACVGVGGRGWDDFNGVRGENIVAICDIDDNNLDNAGKQVPNAQKFNDYRVMLDKVHKEMDAIVVATPDHMHAMIASAGMQLGKHAYVEKPLAHSIFECRMLAKLAEKHKLTTQMGTQIHAEENYRRVVELVQSGAIGGVSEVHVWVGKDWSNGRHPDKGVEPPKNLHWEYWHGGAPYRPYAPNVYHPGNWRRFWDYGTGTLGDMACHYSDVAFWALNLKWPTSAESDSPDKLHPDGTANNLRVKLEFPARDKMPACTYYWYDSARRPDILTEGKLIVNGKPQKWGAGVLFVGDKGMLLCDYGQRFLLPQENFKDFKAPEKSIPRSIGHHNEWIKACKDGTPTTCNFAYSGALSESVLLGNVAFRVGKKLEWDGAKMKATNAPEADKYIREEYRKGWSLSGVDGLV